MVQNDKRLVVFSDQHAERGRQDDGMPFQWRYVAENVFGDESMDSNVEPRPRAGSLPFAHSVTLPGGEKRSLLLMMNYFPRLSAGGALPAFYGRTNAYDKIKTKADALTRLAGRPPNFLAVDYVQRGADGGPFHVWRDLGEQWQQRW